MRKKLLFVLVAVLLTAMIFSTVSAAVGPIGPDGNPACTCIVSVDVDPADGLCDTCGLRIKGDGIADGDGDGDQIPDEPCPD